MKVSNMAQAMASAQAGIQSSVDHANDDAPGWSQRAYTYLSWYAHRCFVPFTAEDVRLNSVFRGVEAPPDARAWGGIFKSAIANGLIEKVGYAPTVSSNSSVRATYRLRRPQ